QNTQDFAKDLRACRDTLPRSDKLIVTPNAGGEKKKLDGIVVTGRNAVADEAELATLGLSKSFDSSEATMRLAALTTTPEEVDEFSKTLKMMSPVAKPGVPKPVAAKPVVRPVIPGRPTPPKVDAGGNSKLIILLLVVLVLFIVIVTR
ncbi:MAG: hypothetical protein WC216_08845, partial [Gallionella sp.]